MDEGCLINFSELKVGDTVFDIIRGEGFVSEINKKEENGEDRLYPVCCMFTETEIRNESEISYTRTGKEFHYNEYPALYKKDPFKYAFEKVKEYKRDVYVANQENNKLWTANQSMKKEIEMLRQTKDA